MAQNIYRSTPCIKSNWFVVVTLMIADSILTAGVNTPAAQSGTMGGIVTDVQTIHIGIIGTTALVAGSFHLKYSDHSHADENDADSANIIIILADDLGYGDLGGYFGGKAETPHLRIQRRHPLFLK